MINKDKIIVNKGWGYEIIFANNNKYCGKLLVFNKDKSFSLHYHLLKDETWYVNNGSFNCKLIDTTIGKTMEFILKQGDSLRILPGQPHQLTALEENSVIFETSTQHFDDDSYRIYKSN
jgi:mannose-6-phosphate isomerase-like protein (cupin superfamily)